jgi:hypothetical protein
MENKPDIINEEKLMCLYQPWRLSEADQEMLSLKSVDLVDKPLIKIFLSVKGKPRDGGGRGGRRGSRRGIGDGRRGRGLGCEFTSRRERYESWRDEGRSIKAIQNASTIP